MTDMKIYLETAGKEAELTEQDLRTDVAYKDRETKPKLRDQEAPQKVSNWLPALEEKGILLPLNPVPRPVYESK